MPLKPERKAINNFTIKLAIEVHFIKRYIFSLFIKALLSVSLKEIRVFLLLSLDSTNNQRE